jgi:TonB family protein
MLYPKKVNNSFAFKRAALPLATALLCLSTLAFSHTNHTRKHPVFISGTHFSSKTVQDTVIDNRIFNAVEIAPSFPGGMQAFNKFIAQNIQYPELAKQNNVSGRVFIQFIVEKDGSLSDLKILRDPGSGLGDEAMRVIKSSPKWKPGMQNGKVVRVQYTVPVNFSL